MVDNAMTSSMLTMVSVDQALVYIRAWSTERQNGLELADAHVSYRYILCLSLTCKKCHGCVAGNKNCQADPWYLVSTMEVKSIP